MIPYIQTSIFLEKILFIFLISFFWSSLIIGFFIVKGGFQKKYFFTDNFFLAFITSIIIIALKNIRELNQLEIFVIISPFITLILFILLFLFRFYRNPKRKVKLDDTKIYSAADGRIIYVKEIDQDTIPISIKKKNMNRLDELTKTDILKAPCYLVGIAMTLFDVHYNRAPVGGKIILLKHTDGQAMGLRNPESTFANERNTFIIEDKNKNLFGIIQIAARGVRRCIALVKENDDVSQGDIIGKIRFGSQVDMIFPRNYTVLVREGDQVYAGISIIASIDE